MRLMGHEIDLTDWHGYRGDMGLEGKTYFDSWHSKNISGICSLSLTPLHIFHHRCSISTADSYSVTASPSLSIITGLSTISVIYHVAPMLHSEGHRRLIGNDVGVIFFLASRPTVRKSTRLNSSHYCAVRMPS